MSADHEQPTPYTLRTTIPSGFDAAVAATREKLGDAGFGVITEIDLRGTLRDKLGIEVADQVILGACNPSFAYQAITTEPSIAALLPCNVVVRSLGDNETLVEAFDPAAMERIADLPTDSAGSEFSDLIGEVHDRIAQVIAALDGVASEEVTV